ncbi:RNA polymerase sigma factor [Deminuibacter soli]|uniref:HTH domain-containing protein n=1 Tax=Deminuibacter soli TaxID=2291815 RepID=A0A3E1NNP4_9BACT|nr:sigma-70 family RNA polymerase sigma factor [Deminuibacter soli]RFM29556.1 HTH domain-containing protein [Deminuibacter soli]
MKAREKTFERIYQQTSTSLYAYVKKFISDTSEIQDILQQCYIKLWLRMDDVVDGENLLPLLITYSKNLMIDSLRKTAGEKKKHQAYHAAKDEMVDMEKQLLNRETIQEISEAIAKMPHKRREIFLLRKEQGLSAAEIAAQLNISKRAVHKHLTEAVRYLKTNVVAVDIIAILFLYSMPVLDVLP